MEKPSFSKKYTKAKEILNKLLKEQLNNRISNLESNSLKELAVLSTLSSSSNTILNNLTQYSSPKSSEISAKSTKNPIKIPKLKFDDIYTNNNSDIKEEVQFIGLESILKNKKYKNGRNKEIPISSIFSNTNRTKTRVSFWKNELENNSKIKATPDIKKKNKSFITFTANNKKENIINKTFINNDNNLIKKKKKVKNVKCLTERLPKDTLKTPLRLHLTKKLCKNNNNTSLNMPLTVKNQKKSKKNITKTSTNFYPKNQKNTENEYNSKTQEIKLKNEIRRHEKNLKSLCESMLIDVNKDELLVNNDTKYLPEFYTTRKISMLNEDENDTNNNKKLLENFKICIQYFIQFLTIKEIFQICKTRKEIFKIVLNIQMKKTEKSIDNINSILKKYNSNNKDFIFPKKLKPFEFNQKSQKAISLLNSISKVNFIKSIKSFNNTNMIDVNKIKNMNKIILIFDIYFISIGKKNVLNNLNSDSTKKIEYIYNYFKNNKNKLLGAIIESDLKDKKFDDFILNNLYEYSKDYIDIINTNYYKKINKDIAIFVFIIKNILDFSGIYDVRLDNKENEQNIIFLHKSRLNAKNIILDKLNEILNKFN